MAGEIGRRRFIGLSLGGAVGVLGGFGATLLDRPEALSTRKDGGGDLNIARRSGHALGTEVRFTILHADPDQAKRAIDAAFAELEAIEEVMSLYRQRSQLCRLNRDGRLDQPHPYLVDVLEAAQSTARLTAGAFDVTVQPLWDIYAAARRAGRQADAGELAAARGRVDFRQLRIRDDHITLEPGMAVTLNGIAQGFATDRVAAVLREHGVAHALIDAGELAALGAQQDQQPWGVGIQHPRQQEAYLELVQLEDRALATSGDYATTFDADLSLNHILDPASGASPGELASVTVAAPTAMEADALSTALFVMGPRRSGELLERLAEVDALLMLKDGRTFSTPGFPSAGGA